MIVSFFLLLEYDLWDEQGGWTSLHCAAEKGHVEVVRVLLAAGAEVNAKTTEVSMYGTSQYCMDESIIVYAV